ncbi:hypothetical protein Nepgr_000935 [Nepenthes gracilis]|uniref:Uncharacterized protein n=1 Tax=Nepenthes gracilis TaxID=150966 RepID=A0AAD3P3L4_NEPGR|nr:hypothetical protein Nepgr_000935 [Nepenthes gracilis]
MFSGSTRYGDFIRLLILSRTFHLLPLLFLFLEPYLLTLLAFYYICCFIIPWCLEMLSSNHESHPTCQKLKLFVLF